MSRTPQNLPRLSRNTHSRELRILVLSGFGVLLLLAKGQANSGDGTTGGPPQMPPFDRATVQKMLAHVEEGENASLLKIGYFTGHHKPIFPVADGYALLKSDIAEAKPESRRWFLLKSLQAWAGIRLGSETRIEGLTVYEQLWGKVAVANRVGASEILRQTIHEFVDEVQMSYIQDRSVDSEVKARARLDLVKSFEAYWDELKRGQIDEETPAWDDAAEATSFQLSYQPSSRSGESSKPAKPKGVVDLIESDLSNPKFANNYWMLKNAALFYRRSVPDRSVEFLQRARLVVPSRNAAEAQWLLGRLVNNLERQHKFPEAVALQKDVIKRTRRGRAKLLCLYAENFSVEHYKNTLETLCAPNADEQDINDAVDLMLNSEPMKHSYGDSTEDAKKLLTAYLTSTRPRSVEQELLARIALSNIFVGQDKPAEAKSALSLANIQVPSPDSDAGLLYEEAQRLQKQIDEKTAPTG